MCVSHKDREVGHSVPIPKMEMGFTQRFRLTRVTSIGCLHLAYLKVNFLSYIIQVERPHKTRPLVRICRLASVSETFYFTKHGSTH